MSETIRVRVCVAVTPDGQAYATGWTEEGDDESRNAAYAFVDRDDLQFRWITATVPAYVAPVELECEADGVEVEA